MSVYNKPWFNTYMNKAGEKEVLVHAFSQQVKKLKEVKHLLDLGSHDGTLLKNILHHAAPNSKLEKIVGVDPADVAKQFYQHVHPFALDTQFYQTTAEAIMQENMPVFDIILASQCLYWTKDLSRMITLINQRSRAACIVLRGNKGIYEIQSHFKELVGNKDEQFYTSTEVASNLEKNNISFTKQSHHTEIIMPEKHSEHWYFMLSFFLQTDIHQLSSDNLEKVASFIDNLTTHRGCIIHQVDFFWLGAWQ